VTLEDLSLRSRVSSLVLCGLFLATACREGMSESEPAPEAVAIVNGEPITVQDFQRALDDIKVEGRGSFTDRERAQRIKRELLERMIEIRVLLQEARRKRIVLDPKVVEASMAMITRGYPAGDVVEDLMKKGKTMEEYRADTERSLLLHKLLKREVIDRIAVSREEIEKYFREHPQDFRKPEEVRVRQIVARSDQDAEKIRKEILRGASFEEMAREHSLGPEAEQGGDLGYFPRGRMPPVIEEACFKLWSNHVSRVTASPYGFHLFQLVDRRPARELSLQEAWPEIERTLVEEKTREAEAYYIRTLREKASIERDLALLETIH
jgi:parvulin-like peptidyl-prolyl isomerase